MSTDQLTHDTVIPNPPKRVKVTASWYWSSIGLGLDLITSQSPWADYKMGLTIQILGLDIWIQFWRRKA